MFISQSGKYYVLSTVNLTITFLSVESMLNKSIYNIRNWEENWKFVDIPDQSGLQIKNIEPSVLPGSEFAKY
jgi:hypothetical protein